MIIILHVNVYLYSHDIIYNDNNNLCKYLFIIILRVNVYLFLIIIYTKIIILCVNVWYSHNNIYDDNNNLCKCLSIIILCVTFFIYSQ